MLLLGARSEHVVYTFLHPIFWLRAVPFILYDIFSDTSVCRGHSMVVYDISSAGNTIFCELPRCGSEGCIIAVPAVPVRNGGQYVGVVRYFKNDVRMF